MTPGWKTDRGKVYILMGPPDARETMGPAEIWKYVFIQGMGHNVRFLFYKARTGIDYRLFQAMNPDEVKDLVSQDEIGTDVTGNGAVGRVFGPAGPSTTMTNLELRVRHLSTAGTRHAAQS